MAKFTTKSIEFKDYQKAIFGDSDDAELYWDGVSNEMRITTVISGVYPTKDSHLTTRQYVDDVSGLDEFTELIDTPSNYTGASGFNVTVKSDGTGLEFTAPGSTVDHGSLLGLNGDDHVYYVPTDGSRGFTATVSGKDPTQDYHLTTKNYVDTKFLETDTFLELTDTPTVYSGSAGKFARVNEAENALYFENAIVGVTSTGIVPPEDSNLWYNSNENIFYYYDPDRGDWLSLNSHNYLYTRQGNIDGLYLSVGDLRHAEAHYDIPKSATVTAIISSSQKVFNPNKGFELHDQYSNVLYSFTQNGWTYNNLNVNATISGGTELRCFCVAAGSKITNPGVTLEVRWRYEV